mgnify:CR=1 FL=1
MSRMDVAKRRESVRHRRHRRVRKRISGTAERPRLVVHRSLKNMEAHIVDDLAGRPLLGVNSRDVGGEGDKVAQAKATGKKLAELAKAAGISRVVFDRGGYLYHGRVRAVAEAAREAGLEF